MLFAITIRLLGVFCIYRLITDKNGILDGQQTFLTLLCGESFQFHCFMHMLLGSKIKRKQEELLTFVRKLTIKYSDASLLEKIHDLSEEIRDCPIRVSCGVEIVDLALYGSVSSIIFRYSP